MPSTLIIDGTRDSLQRLKNKQTFDKIIEGAVVYAGYDDVSLSLTSQSQMASIEGREITSFSKVIVWASHKLDLRLASIVAQIAHINKVSCISNGVESFKGVDKLSQYLCMVQIGVSFPDTLFGKNLTYEQISDVLGRTFVAKDILSSQGNRNELVTTKKELESFRKMHPHSDLLFQKYISGQKEYRLLYVGSEVQVFAREKNTTSYKMNTSHGGRLVAASLNELPDGYDVQMKKLLKQLNIQIAGIDIIYDEHNNPLCLECNYQPRLIGGSESVKKQEILKRFLQR